MIKQDLQHPAHPYFPQLVYTPEFDSGVGEEAHQEAPGAAGQEGGGHYGVTARTQGGPQSHAAGIHVDGAGRLLHHPLQPAAAVHLHLSVHNTDESRTGKTIIKS